MTFETWFHEIETYGLRSERFYDLVQMQQKNPVYAESFVAWLRAAYEAGQGKVNNDENE